MSAETESGADSSKTPPGLEEMRTRYWTERNKRIDHVRAEVPELVGGLQRYLDDPHTATIERAPLNEDDVDVVVIGAGFGGLLAAANLRKAGIRRIRLIDIASDVGGVWYWNRYPGAMCDIESYIYLPLIEELGRIPRDRYSKASEIYNHARAIARHFDLYADGLFHTRVTKARWVESAARWAVTTDHGDQIKARFVVVANGPLSRPKLPAIPGLDTFGGVSFHTSRWDYDYTGGDADSPMTGLAKKAVGIVGTGATAVQCIPPLARSAQHLYVFQRTPVTVGVRNNSPTDPEWAAGLEPGWQDKRMRNFTAVVSGNGVNEDLVNDGWTQLYSDLVAAPDGAPADPVAARLSREGADLRRMEEIRRRIDDIVDDPDVADDLKPYYRYLCKRPCFHDEYLGSFNAPNVTLVNTDGKGVDQVTRAGVVVNGEAFELDCLIFATGV